MIVLCVGVSSGLCAVFNSSDLVDWQAVHDVSA